MGIPFVVEGKGQNERAYDIYSRLLKDRIIVLSETVSEDSASAIIAQMLFLEADDPDRDIKFYINSPGGLVTAGLAIYDTMQHIACDVSTICMGQAASMGAFLLAGGTKGKRFSLPHSRIMVHQVSGGARGTVQDMTINLEEAVRLNNILFEELAINTGQPIEKIKIDADRDKWFAPIDAKNYGLIDEVITKVATKKS